MEASKAWEQAERGSGCSPHLPQIKVVSWVKILVAQGNLGRGQEGKDRRQSVSLPTSSPGSPSIQKHGGSVGEGDLAF